MEKTMKKKRRRKKKRNNPSSHFKKTKKRVGIGLGRKEGKKRPLPFWEACLS